MEMEMRDQSKVFFKKIFKNWEENISEKNNGSFVDML